MARWVKLTSADAGQARPVYVNLDNVTYLLGSDPGTRIWFAGHDEANVVVAEAPEEVVARRTF